jgi:LysM repeat protein
MQTTRKYFTRLLAVLAIAAVAVAAVAIVGSFHSDDSSGKNGAHQAKEQKPQKHRTKAKAYTVESGDTLTAISHKTGIPVAEILALNPEVDPQILIAGESLKLK